MIIDLFFALLLVLAGSGILYVLSWLLTMAVGGFLFIAYQFARLMVALTRRFS